MSRPFAVRLSDSMVTVPLYVSCLVYVLSTMVVCLCVRPSVCLHVCMSACMHAYLPVRVSVRRFESVCLFIHRLLSLDPSVVLRRLLGSRPPEPCCPEQMPTCGSFANSAHERIGEVILRFDVMSSRWPLFPPSPFLFSRVGSFNPGGSGLRRELALREVRQEVWRAQAKAWLGGRSLSDAWANPLSRDPSRWLDNNPTFC